jgi:hypothetical protein
MSLSGLLDPLAPPLKIEPSRSRAIGQGGYCGRPDIRQARGPGWMGLRSDRQYADQPD